MEVCGSFKTITGGICGSDSRDRKKDIQVVPLSACSKDIENHLSSYSFTGPVNEVELILCRAAIFKMPGNLESMTVCPRCRIPLHLSNHGKGRNKTWPKGDRGLGKHESEVVFRKTGVFVQPGSGKILKTQFSQIEVYFYYF